MNFNQVILLGNVTRDPQFRYLSSQKAVAEFGLAVNKKFKRQDGTEGEKVLFIDCRIYGKGAEVINQYVRKGSALFLSGELDYETWEDKNGGGTRSKHLLTVEDFQFVGSRPQQQGDQQQGSRPAGNSNRRPANTRPPAEVPFSEDQQFKDDDIPF